MNHHNLFAAGPWLVGLTGAAALIAFVALGARLFLRGWWRHLRATRERIRAEDAVKHIHHGEQGGRPVTCRSLAERLRLNRRAVVKLTARLEAQGWLRRSGERLSLTPEGVRLALQVIRAHRLWERYLVDEARMPIARVHAEAERREHAHPAEHLDALEAAMGHPATDPHGDPIPTARGELAEQPAFALTDWPVGKPARIVHLEDEPPAVFAQIAAVGLRPGQTIRVLEAKARRIVVTDGEDTHLLAPVVGANIFVRAVEATEAPGPRRRLSSLTPGTQATVRALGESLQGLTRRRLLDLGLTPGAAITAEMSGMFHDPVAYRIRGSMIALRRDQAEHVLIDIDGHGKPTDG